MKSSQKLARSARSLLHPFPISAVTSRQTPSLVAGLPRLSPSHAQSILALNRRRNFSTSQPTYKGLQPHSDDPKAPLSEDHHTTSHAAEPASITDEEYHAAADTYIDSLLRSLEEKAEEVEKGFEVEYSAGVLTVNTPSGTYVINKQPPNKQIWLSSPISGPFRYDWVITGDSMHQKEGTETHDEGAGGKWMYLRDGSTLSKLVEKELDVEIGGEGA